MLRRDKRKLKSKSLLHKRKNKEEKLNKERRERKFIKRFKNAKHI